MREENRLLFSNAIYTALNERFDEELSSCADIKPSKRHISVIKAIIRERKILNISSKKIPLRLLVAAILAITLLLTACVTALLYRNEFKTFSEEVYTDHIDLIFGDKSGTSSSETIENFYELTYLPEGYELVFEDISQGIVFYQYALDENNTIQFNQFLLGSTNIRLDSKNYERIIIDGEKEIYCYKADYYTSYFWTDSNSIIELTFYSNLDESETEKVLKGVNLKK